MATDLERRPRGGWQTGSSLRARLGGGSEPLWLRGDADPAPDCYTVEYLAGGVLRVRHFPDRSTRRPCCTAKVLPRPGESTVDSLHRAYLLIERQHAATGS